MLRAMERFFKDMDLTPTHLTGLLGSSLLAEKRGEGITSRQCQHGLK